MKFATAALAAALFAVSAPAASAAVFTDRADFLASVGAASENDLDSAPDVATFDFGAFTATAIGSEDEGPMDADHFGFKPAIVTEGVSLQFTSASEYAIFTFDSPIYAFGFDLVALGDYIESGDVMVTINEVSHTLFTFDEGDQPVRTFLGFTSTTAFKTIKVSATGFGPMEVDNILYAGGVPEPSTWAMMLMGFGALGVVLRRRRLTAA